MSLQLGVQSLLYCVVGPSSSHLSPEAEKQISYGKPALHPSSLYGRRGCRKAQSFSCCCMTLLTLALEGFVQVLPLRKQQQGLESCWRCHLSRGKADRAQSSESQLRHGQLQNSCRLPKCCIPAAAQPSLTQPLQLQQLSSCASEGNGSEIAGQQPTVSRCTRAQGKRSFSWPLAELWQLVPSCRLLLGSFTERTFPLLACQLLPGELHVKGDDQGAFDVVVVKVWETFSFLPELGPRLRNFISSNVNLETKGHFRRLLLLSARPFRSNKQLQLLLTACQRQWCPKGPDRIPARTNSTPDAEVL